ncbi:MAG: hypothetical protein VB064_00975 [Oscillospiraceae bacterium]|nr:hypothetical protein [Oscillospiraceae bacterium]
MSVIIVIACTVLSIYAINAKKGERQYNLGEYSSISISEAEEAFIKTQDNGDLIALLKVLCYNAVEKNDAAAKTKIKGYGSLLYDRARSGEIDLSKTGESDDNMLELLYWIQQYGAE